jgi:hypothetical protein
MAPWHMEFHGCALIYDRTHPVESLMTLSSVRLWKQEFMPNAY